MRISGEPVGGGLSGGGGQRRGRVLHPHVAYGRGRSRLEPGGLRDCTGQATVEYLVVLGAFVSMLAGLALIWHAGGDGDLSDRAAAAASHGTEQGSTALLKDVLRY